MSLIHMDGFDLYASNADVSAIYTSNMSLNTTAGRFGGGAIYSGAYYYYMAYPMPAGHTEVWVGMAYNCQNGSSSGGLLGFYSASGCEGALFYNASSNTLTLCTNSGNNNIVGTVSGVYLLSAYHWIEVHFKMHASAGVMELWVDGVQLLNLTGLNTTSRGGSTLSSVYFANDQSGDGLACYIDDIYILDPTTGSFNTGRLGDSRIETLKPTSDASPNNGTPSTAGAHYAMVSENQNDGTTSYVTITGTSGQEELYGTGSLSGTPATVRAVKVTNWVEKSDAGALAGNAMAVSSATVGTGASIPFITTFNTVANIFESDPHTSAAWTYSAVNSANVGLKIT